MKNATIVNGEIVMLYDSEEIAPDSVYICYTNHRGKFQSNRRIIPKSIRYGSTEWHTDPQWLLDAYDMGKEADRTFAIKDIIRWSTAPTDLAGGPVVMNP